ncbi:MAG: sensor histidine kinase [Desulfobacter sp.]|nr:MAG: sensor histidine kinase [Desulfobacter sp.]
MVSLAIFASFIADISKSQISKRALDIGHCLAQMPVVQQVLTQGTDPEKRLQELAEQVRLKTGAQFVVIADKNSFRYSHPDPEKIGQRFVGSDEVDALTLGKAYVSEATGTLGLSLRSLVPVFNFQGKVIGFVSVGYLQTQVVGTIQGYQREPATLVFMLFVVVLLGASGIARYVKKQTLGLEPRQISSLYLDRQAIFESIQNGIIAVGGKGEIRLINQAAIDFCRFENQESLIGKSIDEVFVHSDFLSLLKGRKRIVPHEFTVDGKPVLFTAFPIEYSEKVQGLVASFSPLEDFYRLRKKLRHTLEFSEMLRVQAHEYSNKLHTLAGLLQMKSYQEAIELVTRESSGLQNLIGMLARAVPHPALAAIIMGKYNRALEMKVTFDFNPDSTMEKIPDDYDFDKLVTILGNLLDNALEAALKSPARSNGQSPCIRLFMTDYGHDLIFEIEDSGPGICLDCQDRIFSKGYSTKQSIKGLDNIHGVGLFLVDQYVTDLNGQVIVSTGELGGALFTLSLPKQVKES